MTQDQKPFDVQASPLDDSDLERLTEAQTMLQRAREQIDLAKSANLDVSRAEDRVAELDTQIRSIKTVYFPGR